MNGASAAILLAKCEGIALKASIYATIKIGQNKAKQ
jgi:hypothetical protein